jgi:hypothetical protein
MVFAIIVIWLLAGVVVWIAALVKAYPNQKPGQDDSTGLGFVLTFVFAPLIILGWPMQLWDWYRGR